MMSRFYLKTASEGNDGLLGHACIHGKISEEYGEGDVVELPGYLSGGIQYLDSTMLRELAEAIGKLADSLDEDGPEFRPMEFIGGASAE